MNPNSRQVYTCISSADRLGISHTVSIRFFLRIEGVGFKGLGGCSDMLFSKILPETKSKLSSSQCTLVFFFSFPKDRDDEKCAKVPWSHFHIPKGWLPFLYTSAFWLFSSTFSSSFFSSSEDPFSFSPVFQLPCLDFFM